MNKPETINGNIKDYIVFEHNLNKEFDFGNISLEEKENEIISKYRDFKKLLNDTADNTKDIQTINLLTFLLDCDRDAVLHNVELLYEYYTFAEKVIEWIKEHSRYYNGDLTDYFSHNCLYLRSSNLLDFINANFKKINGGKGNGSN